MVSPQKTYGGGILVVLKDQGSLYMRPAAMLAKIANQFESDVVLEHKKTRANGKSLLDMITLGIGTGAKFKIFASGKDAKGAIHAIRIFFRRFFIEGHVSEAVAEECAMSGKSLVSNSEQCSKPVKTSEGEMTASDHQRPDGWRDICAEDSRPHKFTWPLSEDVKDVSLAGDFNGWIPEPMEKSVSGFQAVVRLKPGVYQYKFIVDGQWQVDPSAMENAQNPFGTDNSVLLVDRK